mmetsp:Transcript_137663/g.250916  ORF Transcript_137663/g.250916 Transcript_137663/m.250916 type:complete len:445 (-) Transcript_137663:107-1441(-)
MDMQPRAGGEVVCILYGRKYRLTEEFIAKHPGGRDLLWGAVASGIDDLTAVFELHHLNIDHARRMLETLRVTNSKEGDDKVSLTYGTGDDLYHELRGQVLAGFKRAGRGTMHRRRPTWRIVFLFVFTALLWLVTLCQTLKQGSYLCAMATGILAVWLSGFGHIGVHSPFPESRCMAWFLNLYGLSCTWWRVSHVINHHTFVNKTKDTGRPYDSYVDGWNPLLSFHPTRKRSLLMRACALWHHGLFMMGTTLDHPLTYFKPLMRGTSRVPLMLTQLIFPGLWALYALAAAGGALQGTCLFSTTVATASLYFLNIAHMNHNQDESWTEAEFGSLGIAEWQIRNTVDIQIPGNPKPGSWADLIGSMALCFLNRHTAHHLFPSVDPSHFGIVEEAKAMVCSKHNISLVQKSIWACYVDMVRQMMPIDALGIARTKQWPLHCVVRSKLA